MGKHKQEHKEIYDRLINTYEYNSDYDPSAELLIDTALDMELMYGTLYPNHDKTDYSKYITRDYAKRDNADKDKE